MMVRLVAAVAALVSAAVHLYLWLDGVREQGTVGQLFVVNVVAGVAIPVLLVAWRHWIPLFLVAGFGAATLGAFVISATVGLFGIEASWDTWYAWLAAASEIVAIVTGLWGLRAEGWLASLGSRRQPQH